MPLLSSSSSQSCPPKSSLTQPFNKADFHLIIKHATWIKAAAALGWRVDHVKILNQEALNMLIPLCLRMAKDPRLIPERLKPFISFFGGQVTQLPSERRAIRSIPHCNRDCLFS